MDKRERGLVYVFLDALSTNYTLFIHKHWDQVNQVTGERVPSMCPPHPPSSDSIDDILGTALEEDLDDAYRPINTARVHAVRLPYICWNI